MLRFHLPLIEPDERVSRIRLSDKGHDFTHELHLMCLAVACRGRVELHLEQLRFRRMLTWLQHYAEKLSLLGFLSSEQPFSDVLRHGHEPGIVDAFAVHRGHIVA